MAASIAAPLIVGKTPTVERERLYADFKAGRIPILVVSKVGNFAIDLPDANVAVQVSGTFGSRQEEAQRLGRILRPKSNGAPATFYSLVSKDTKEEECAERRQRYLTERGYTYRIVSLAQLPKGSDPLPTAANGATGTPE
jgi:DNA excision repair protein ERCC-3